MGIKQNGLFIGKPVLSATVGAPLSADANGLLSSGLSNNEATATADATTTSASDVLMTSMTLTPAAGTYMVWFSAWFDHSAQVTPITVSIYSGGSQLTHSVRQVETTTNAIGSQSLSSNLSTQGKVTVNGSQAIEIRWNRGSTGTGTVHQRSMFILRLS